MGETAGIVTAIIRTIGAPGVLLLFMAAPSIIMVMMYIDHRRYDRERRESLISESIRQASDAEQKAREESRHREELDRVRDERMAVKEQLLSIISQQDKRFEAVVRNYESNVILVENYQKLANDLAGIIHLNTQAMTKLIEKIDNNMFCPISREGMRK